MAVVVKGPGFASPQVGTVQTRSTPTPFQNFRVPLLDGKARALAQQGKMTEGIFDAFNEIGKAAATIKGNRDDTTALKIQRLLIQRQEEEERDWKLPAERSDGSGGVVINEKSAYGERANDDWARDMLGSYESYAEQLKEENGYDGMGANHKRALDVKIENFKADLRRKVFGWQVDQVNQAKTAELNATLDAAKRSVASSSPDEVDARIQEIVGIVEEQGKLLGWSDVQTSEAIQVQAADALNKTVNNLLDDEDIMGARLALADGRTVKINGQDVELDSDVIEDLETAITEANSASRIVSAAEELYTPGASSEELRARVKAKREAGQITAEEGDAVLSRMIDRETLRLRDKQRSEQKVLDQASAFVATGGNPDELPNSTKRLLGATQLQTLRNAYVSLRTMPSRTESFANIAVTQGFLINMDELVAGGASLEQIQAEAVSRGVTTSQFTQISEAFRESKDETAGKPLTISTVTKRTREYLATRLDLAVDKDDPDSSDSVKALQFEQRVIQEVEALRAAGRPLRSETDLGEVLDRLGSEAMDDVLGLVKIDGVPDHLVDDLVHEMRNLGLDHDDPHQVRLFFRDALIASADKRVSDKQRRLWLKDVEQQMIDLGEPLVDLDFQPNASKSEKTRLQAIEAPTVQPGSLIDQGAVNRVHDLLKGIRSAQ